MGAYLHVGFVAKATTSLSNGISKEELLEEIKEYYPGDTYLCVEEGNELIFTLKPEVLQAELLPFVRQVYEDFHGDPERGWLKTALEFIQKSVGSPDWLEQAEEADLYDFSPSDDGLSDDFKIKGKDIHLYTSLVTLGSEGKFLMEESSKTLGFMETCARQSYNKFRLGRTFRVFVL
jgi:hypothetical protein